MSYIATKTEGRNPGQSNRNPPPRTHCMPHLPTNAANILYNLPGLSPRVPSLSLVPPAGRSFYPKVSAYILWRSSFNKPRSGFRPTRTPLLSQTQSITLASMAASYGLYSFASSSTTTNAPRKIDGDKTPGCARDHQPNHKLKSHETREYNPEALAALS